VIINAFQNASNRDTYAVKKNGSLFDLTAEGVTRLEIIVNGRSISSDNDKVVFSGSNLTVEWGALDIDSGTFSPVIYAYSPSAAEGEVIFADTESLISLEVAADERLPVLILTADKETYKAGETITLTASATALDGGAVTYLWSSGETTQTITAIAPTSGVVTTVNRTCVASDGTFESNIVPIAANISAEIGAAWDSTDNNARVWFN
jgi:hypothetical protein